MALMKCLVMEMLTLRQDKQMFSAYMNEASAAAAIVSKLVTGNNQYKPNLFKTETKSNH
jgi:type IV secretory pathway VirB3-like protein